MNAIVGRGSIILGACLCCTSAAQALQDYDPIHAQTLDSMASRATKIIVATVSIHPIGTQSDDLGWRTVWTRADLIASKSVIPDTSNLAPDTFRSFMLSGNYMKADGRPGRVGSEDEPFSECGCDGAECLIFLAGWVPAGSGVFGGEVLRPVGNDGHAILPIDGEGRVQNVPLRIKGEYSLVTLPLDDCIARIRTARAAAGLNSVSQESSHGRK